MFTLDYSWCLRPAAVHIWICIWTSSKSCDYSVCCCDDLTFLGFGWAMQSTHGFTRSVVTQMVAQRWEPAASRIISIGLVACSNEFCLCFHYPAKVHNLAFKRRNDCRKWEELVAGYLRNGCWVNPRWMENSAAWWVEGIWNNSAIIPCDGLELEGDIHSLLNAWETFSGTQSRFPRNLTKSGH